MNPPSRQVIVLGAALLLVVVVSGIIALLTRRPVAIAFWFEPITEEVRMSAPERITGGITDQDMAIIERTATSEVVRAFEGLPVLVSADRNEIYHVRVLSRLGRNASGASHVIIGLGGQGYINFELHAYGAVAYAPAGASRDDIIAGIGRGIGRAAVHEFVHQLLGPSARIEDMRDKQSYEYHSATRPEQYYGPAHWGIAAPMLRKRFGLE
jgi:hypothetical protein